MRTKEEILKKNDVYDALSVNSWILDSVDDSMEEYATIYADEQSVAFAEFLLLNYQPRFPNKKEWLKVDNSRLYNPVYTTSELLQIFKNENK